MTKDELRNMALEAGFRKDDSGIYHSDLPDRDDLAGALEKFSELVTQEETLRCVTILLKMHDKAKSQHNYYLHAAGMLTRKDGE